MTGGGERARPARTGDVAGEVTGDARSDQSVAGARPKRRLTQYAAGGG